MNKHITEAANGGTETKWSNFSHPDVNEKEPEIVIVSTEVAQLESHPVLKHQKTTGQEIYFTSKRVDGLEARFEDFSNLIEQVRLRL